jgi:bacterioferritin
MSANLFSAELDGFYPFLSEVAQMRRRARRLIEQALGAATEHSTAHPTVLQLLNEALTTELVCVSRYRNHSMLAGGALAESVRAEFLKYAQEEQGHAEQLAKRILQLGGEPNLQAPVASSAPAASPADEIEAEALADLLEEDLIAERIAIESYREIVQFVGASDARTRQLLEAILAVEITHAQELAAMRSEMLRRDRLGGTTSTTLPRLELQCA